MFEIVRLHDEKQEKLLLSCSGLFIDNLEHVHNWVGCFFSDNDQVKAAGKYYVNVKLV